MTLIELMISITIAMIVLAGVITVFGSTVRSSTDVLKASKLNQNMQAAMNIIVEDIRRAGYWDNTAVATTTNPFTDAGADNLNRVSASCILYAYDRSTGGTTNGTVQNAERYGFRLTSNAIMMRTSGANNTNCTNVNDTWENLTDNNSATISALTFTMYYKCADVTNNTTAVATACTTPASGESKVETRRITISMTGTLTGDNAVTKTITESIRVRNDRLLTTP